MNKRYLAVGIVVFIILLIILAGLIFYRNAKQPANLEFSASECDENMTLAVTIGTFSAESQSKEIAKLKQEHNIEIKPISLGLQEHEWLNGSTLYARAVILINCAYKISSGDYKISGNNLTLEYIIKKPFGGIAAHCRCAHELVYKIKDIEKRDFDLQIGTA